MPCVTLLTKHGFANKACWILLYNIVTVYNISRSTSLTFQTIITMKTSCLKEFREYWWPSIGRLRTHEPTYPNNQAKAFEATVSLFRCSWTHPPPPPPYLYPKCRWHRCHPLPIRPCFGNGFLIWPNPKKPERFFYYSYMFIGTLSHSLGASARKMTDGISVANVLVSMFRAVLEHRYGARQPPWFCSIDPRGELTLTTVGRRQEAWTRGMNVCVTLSVPATLTRYTWTISSMLMSMTGSYGEWLKLSTPGNNQKQNSWKIMKKCWLLL